jgi:TM2 domain-containing membrane protein YozV
MSQGPGPGWGPPPGWQAPSDPPPPGAPPVGSPPPQWSPPPPPGQPNQPYKSCYACQSIIDSRALDCPRCGVRQPDMAVGYGKDRLIATLLALLLGSFGAHRFYLGNIALGVVYLLFFWTGVPGFIAWLEAIWFLTRSDEGWARMYGGPVQRPNGCALGCLWLLALWPLLAIVGFAITLVLGLQIAWISSL